MVHWWKDRRVPRVFTSFKTSKWCPFPKIIGCWINKSSIIIKHHRASSNIIEHVPHIIKNPMANIALKTNRAAVPAPVIAPLLRACVNRGDGIAPGYGLFSGVEQQHSEITSALVRVPCCWYRCRCGIYIYIYIHMIICIYIYIII